MGVTHSLDPAGRSETPNEDLHGEVFATRSRTTNWIGKSCRVESPLRLIMDRRVAVQFHRLLEGGTLRGTLPMENNGLYVKSGRRCRDRAASAHRVTL